MINNEESLWRTTDQKWLIILLAKGSISPLYNSTFISLSFNIDSGGQDSFGNAEIRIEFDKEKIFNQGAEEIWYDSDWFYEREKESMYVLGYNSEQDYYDNHDYDNAEEANEQLELTWEDHISDFEHEAEILMNRMSYESDLITHVNIFKNPTFSTKNLIKLLNDLNISYDIKN